jgi:hypothetical protein
MVDFSLVIVSMDGNAKAGMPDAGDDARVDEGFAKELRILVREIKRKDSAGVA